MVLFCSKAWTPFIHPKFRSMNHSCKGIHADKVLRATLKNCLQKYGSNDANPRMWNGGENSLKLLLQETLKINVVCAGKGGKKGSLSLKAKLVWFVLGNETTKVHLRYFLPLSWPLNFCSCHKYCLPFLPPKSRRCGITLALLAKLLPTVPTSSGGIASPRLEGHLPICFTFISLDLEKQTYVLQQHS